MIVHLLKTAVRSILKRKLYSVISILGLAVGMTVCIMITTFVNYEYSFDSMHPDSDRLFRIIRENSETGAQLALFFNPMAERLTQSFPEIESFTRVDMREALITVGEESIFQSISMADSNFFSLLPSAVISGDPTTALNDTSTIVLTEAAAIRLFGDTNPLGQLVTINTNMDFRVGAIVANNHPNSHLVGNYFINIANAPEVWGFPPILESVRSASTFNYVKLIDGANISELEEKTNSYIRDEIDPLFNYQVRYQPLTEIHFSPGFLEEVSETDEVTGVFKPFRSSSTMVIYIAVAVLTLTIAIFNFINLQIAQASRRLREIGIRKTIGAQRVEIAIQFLAEILLMSFIALALAFWFIQLITPYFKSVVAAPLDIFIPNGPFEIASVIGIALCLGILAGAYPASIVAGLAPVQTLKGNLSDNLGSTKLRSILVLLQFSVSISLIIAASVINKQIDYAMTRPLGLNPENVVILSNIRNSQAGEAFDRMREQLLDVPSILSVGASTAIPTQTGGGVQPFSIVGEPAENTYSVRGTQISEDYLETLEISLIAGRYLSEEFGTDRVIRVGGPDGPRQGATVVNQSLVEAFGWETPEEALGRSIYRNDLTFTIVGVAEDAHFQPIYSPIDPRYFTLINIIQFMTIKLAPDYNSDTLQSIDRIWNENVPNYPIQRSFLTDEYAATYASEERTFRLLIGMSVIAIILSCLGLYALASLIAEQRTKEIGIRKTLGAGVGRITALLSWDFSKIVILSNLVAWPLVWWFMQQWLNLFSYRTEMTVAMFAYSGILAFLLAVGTIFLRSWKVATSNPADALRFE